MGEDLRLKGVKQFFFLTAAVAWRFPRSLPLGMGGMGEGGLLEGA